MCVYGKDKTHNYVHMFNRFMKYYSRINVFC